jgi:hypothetical protein
MKKVNKKLPKAQTGIISKVAKAAKTIVKPIPKPKPKPTVFGESGQYGRKIDFIMSQAKNNPKVLKDFQKEQANKTALKLLAGMGVGTAAAIGAQSIIDNSKKDVKKIDTKKLLKDSSSKMLNKEKKGGSIKSKMKITKKSR